MSKKSRQQELLKRLALKGNGKKPAVDPSAPKQHHLTPLQSMGVQLMVARETVQRKNDIIAKLQELHSIRAKQDSDRIGQLELEVADLTKRVMQFASNSEVAENNALAQQLGLPMGTVNYKRNPDGTYYWEEQPAPAGQPAPAAPVPQAAPAEKLPVVPATPAAPASAVLEDDDEDDDMAGLTKEERRMLLEAQLEALEDDEPEATPAPAAAQPALAAEKVAAKA